MIINFETHYNDLVYRLNEIKDFYSFTEENRKLKFIDKNYNPTTEKEEAFKAYLTFLNEKNIDNVTYNAVIITHYGCYEDYIREISREYIKYIIDKKQTSDNFNKIYSKYQENIIKQLNSGNIDYGKTKNEVIEELYDTHIKNTYNKISISLAAVHGGNLSYKYLRNYLVDDLGLKLEDIKYFDEYKNLYNTNNGNSPYEEICVDNKHTFSLLDNLVEERNSVAHTGRSGGVKINVNETIKYLNVLCRSILLLIETEVSKFFIDATKIFPIEVFNHKILGFKNNGMIKIKKNDYIYVKTNKISFVNHIKNIRQNFIDVENTDNDREYAFEFEYRVKKNYEFYIIDKDKI